MSYISFVLTSAVLVSFASATIDISIYSGNMPLVQAQAALESLKEAYEMYPNSEQYRFQAFSALFEAKYPKTKWNVANLCGGLYTPNSNQYEVLLVEQSSGASEKVMIYN